MRWSARSPTCQSPVAADSIGDALAESRAFGEGAQHDLGHRRAADVAGADEGHSEGLRGVPRGFRSRHGPIVDEIGGRHSRQIPPALRWAIRAVEGNEMTDAPAPDFHVDEALAARLVAAQHPDLAGPVRLVANGWDNAVFRLGDALLGADAAPRGGGRADPQRAALARRARTAPARGGARTRAERPTRAGARLRRAVEHRAVVRRARTASRSTRAPAGSPSTRSPRSSPS